jgi:hypothetical protein
MFTRLTLTPGAAWEDVRFRIAGKQKQFTALMQKWKTKYHLTTTTVWGRKLLLAQGRIVLPPHHQLRKDMIKYYHNMPTAGHDGRDETIRKVSRNLWWPGINAWVTNFVKGCATCQQNKNLTHRKKVPLYSFPAATSPFPFKEVALNLITQLPKSNGYDAILTIVDQGCSRAAVFLPCKTAITGEEVATLYLENVYRWFGLPTKVISDRDP